MQAILEIPTVSPPIISLADAHHVARTYVATAIDPTFTVVSDRHTNDPQANPRTIWRFFMLCAHGPLCALKVDAATGEVIPLSATEIRVMREKAAIYAARTEGVLPLNEQGYVLGEYARKRADRYLGDQIGMYFDATDPVFVPRESPCWQVTIVFKRYHLGPFTLGVMDVDAKTGEPIPLTKTQLKRIRERTHAFIEFHTQTAAA
ncbi:MAG: hypothetical protein R3C14_33150 [Caldilineaceae bacterium]